MLCDCLVCEQQRNQLTSLKDQRDVLMELFMWYGSYLMWTRCETTLVVHLRGRHFDPVRDQEREREREKGQCSPLQSAEGGGTENSVIESANAVC